jgi:hypothetical protein
MRTKLTTILSATILASATYCGCSADRSTKPEAASATVSKNQELLNNSASLLASLLKDEKNLNKILLIKSHSKELGGLIDAISRAAADGEKQLEVLAQDDPGLNLNALELPSGEQAARKAIAKTKEYDLLFSSGDSPIEVSSYNTSLSFVRAHGPPPQRPGSTLEARLELTQGALATFCQRRPARDLARQHFGKLLGKLPIYRFRMRLVRNYLRRALSGFDPHPGHQLGVLGPLRSEEVTEDHRKTRELR